MLAKTSIVSDNHSLFMPLLTFSFPMTLTFDP